MESREAKPQAMGARWIEGAKAMSPKLDGMHRIYPRCRRTKTDSRAINGKGRYQCLHCRGRGGVDANANAEGKKAMNLAQDLGRRDRSSGKSSPSSSQCHSAASAKCHRCALSPTPDSDSVTRTRKDTACSLPSHGHTGAHRRALISPPPRAPWMTVALTATSILGDTLCLQFLKNRLPRQLAYWPTRS